MKVFPSALLVSMYSSILLRQLSTSIPWPLFESSPGLQIHRFFPSKPLPIITLIDLPLHLIEALSELFIFHIVFVLHMESQRNIFERVSLVI